MDYGSRLEFKLGTHAWLVVMGKLGCIIEQQQAVSTQDVDLNREVVLVLVKVNVTVGRRASCRREDEPLASARSAGVQPTRRRRP